MNSVSLSLLVLKTHSPERLRAFYEALGVAFVRERHGTGPEHYAAAVGGVVLELYPLREGEPVDVSTRLGFSVPDLDGVAGRVPTGAVVRPPEGTPHGRRAVLRDTDGRAVELYEVE